MLLISSLPVGASEDYFIQHYEWNFREPRPWSWELNISLDRLNGYKEFSQSKRRNYGFMITTKDPTLNRAATAFRNASQKKRYAEQTELSFVLSFVQSLDYTSDKVTTGYDEYPRFPLETLADMGGDCEDSSILFATLVILMGYDAVLLIIPGTLENPGHMGVGVSGEGLSGSYVSHNGIDYYYAETTGLDWKIGDLPPEYEISQMRVVEFTGEQYDPMADDDVVSLLEKFIDQYPERLVLLLICIIILILIIYRLISKNVAAHKRNRSEDFFTPDNEQRYPPDDVDPWEKTDPDPGPASRSKGPFFFDPTENPTLDRNVGGRTRAARERCPHCSTYLWYTPLLDEWWCDRCGSVSSQGSGRPPGRVNDTRYEDFEY